MKFFMKNYCYDELMMSMLLTVIDELYAYYYCFLKSHPFCLEMLPLYVGNLQVTKNSRGREWILSHVS